MPLQSARVLGIAFALYLAAYAPGRTQTTGPLVRALSPTRSAFTGSVRTARHVAEHPRVGSLLRCPASE